VLKFSLDTKLIKSIVKYTLPLIPNSISWWIVNSSDRYIVYFNLGQASNGIYSVANKFPTVISTLAGIMYFAFQESMIKEYYSVDRNEFYSKLFKKYYYFLFSLVLCGVPLTKIVINLFVGAAYQEAWKYTGFLFLSTVFCALSSFLGIGYQIAKDTKKSAYTTIIAAVTNIIINTATIKMIGLHAASFSTLAAYMLLMIIRINQCKQYFQLNVHWKQFSVLMLVSLAFISISYLSNTIVNICLSVVGITIFLLANKKIIRRILRLNLKGN
jgi:O-antigen/teichoic acid export membrane protein